MLHSNFSEGEKCWLCDGPSNGWLERLEPTDAFPEGPRPKYTDNIASLAMLMYFANGMAPTFGRFRWRTEWGTTSTATAAQAVFSSTGGQAKGGNHWATAIGIVKSGLFLGVERFVQTALGGV